MREGRLTIGQLLLSFKRETIMIGDFPLGDSHEEQQIFKSGDSDWSNLTLKHDLTLINVNPNTHHLMHGRQSDRVSYQRRRRSSSGRLMIFRDFSSRHEEGGSDDGRREERRMKLSSSWTLSINHGLIVHGDVEA